MKAINLFQIIVLVISVILIIMSVFIVNEYFLAGTDKTAALILAFLFSYAIVCYYFLVCWSIKAWPKNG